MGVGASDRRTGRRRRLKFRAAVLLCGALLTAACSSGDPGADSEPSPQSIPPDESSESESEDSSREPGGDPAAQSDADEESDERTDGDEETEAPDDPRAGETIDWRDCGGVDCGAISVPVDYSRPEAGDLSMAVLVHRATDPAIRIGYLFVNPGGPGGSGLDYAETALAGPGYAFTEAMIERFDIVGFDPRGVGESEPAFECGLPGEELALLSSIDLDYSSPEDIMAGEAAVRLCVDSMGAATGLLHTENVARDMDELRKALGAEQISYFGVSYGSTVGVWYATLFPESVRAMVVDGADNPLDDMSTQEARISNLIEELAQFEVQLGEALDACDTPDCPIYNDGDPRGYFLDNVGRLDDVAAAAGGNPVAGPLGVISTLYSQTEWPLLWFGLHELVEQDDPAVLAELAAFQLGDSTGGTTITQHINCLDSWALFPHLDRQVRLSDSAAMQVAVEEALPLLGAMDFSAPETCPFYDTLEIAPFEGTLNGSGTPILVIGNPTDPATPFTESEELAIETLDNGYLLRVDHPAHGVLPYNACAIDAADSLLVDLELPTDRVGDCQAQ